MSIWTPNYPTSLDDGDSLPSIAAYETPDASHLNALKDVAIELEKRIGVGAGVAWDYLSATRPTGAANDPVALYHFDGDGIDDRTGGGRDLAVETGEMHYLTHNGIACGAFSGDESLKAATDSALRILGAVTIEAVIMQFSTAVGTIIQVAGDAAVESEENNVVYSAGMIAPVGKINYFSEYGAGLNNWVYSDIIPPLGSLCLATITRDAAGNVSFYIDGVLRDGPSASTPPTGGTVANLRIGNNFDQTSGFVGLISSCRVTDEEFSAATVAAVWDQVKGVA